MAVQKFADLKDLSDEQIRLTIDDTMQSLFRLRLKAETERLDAPSELRKHRRMIAQLKTIQTQRERAKKGSSHA